ncbi:uncharacterized protein LOC120347063 [Styela clava]
MKKRRELDALIGNRAKRDSGIPENGRLEYDSLSSLSSPTADTYMAPSGNYFNVPSKRVSRTSGRGCGCTVRRMIRICLPACFLSLVAACITACIGIVWMQVQLKTDVEKLRDKVAKLETWQSNQPSALEDMKKTMTDMQKDMTSMNDGENGVKILAEKLATLTQKFEDQVVVPNKRLDQLQTQAQDVKKTIEEIKSSMKNMGTSVEEINTSQNILTASYNTILKSIDDIKAEASDSNVKQLTDLVSSSKQNTEDGIIKINTTLQEIAANLTMLQHTVNDLEQKTSADQIWEGLNPRISGLQQDISNLKKEKQSEDETLGSITREISALQSRLSQIASSVEETKNKKMGHASSENIDINSDRPPDQEINANSKDSESKLTGSSTIKQEKPKNIGASHAQQDNVKNEQAEIEHTVGAENNSPAIKSEVSNKNPQNKQPDPGGRELGSESNEADIKSSNIEDANPKQKQQNLVDIFTGIQKRFIELDKNSDGKLTKDELIATIDENLIPSLLKYDVDNDGALSKTEISKVSLTSSQRKRKRKAKR